MFHICLYFAVLLLQLHSKVSGYMIDGDCGEDTQFVQDRIDTAFRLIANTVTELNKSPISANIQNLHKELFALDFDHTRIGNVRRRFEQLSRLSQRNDNDQTDFVQGRKKEDNIIDVKFYCTTKRIGKNGEGNYVNKDRGIEYKDGELTRPGGRFANCFSVNPPALMVTLTVPTDAHHSEIQICPWFLRQARGFRIKDIQHIPSSVWGGLSKVAIPVSAKLQYSPIDIFILADKTIVHELTHTSQAYPATRDMGEKPYGWKNAKKMVQKYNQNGQVAEFDPLMNADSNSLFALAAWILNQPDGGPVAPDGTFKKPSATPKAKA